MKVLREEKVRDAILLVYANKQVPSSFLPNLFLALTFLFFTPL